MDEPAFHFDNRKANDGKRFVRALATVPTARLTFEKLTRAEHT